MTDNEIIKALECCVNNKHICPHNCPMLKNKECLVSLRKNALDLINRLQAELKVCNEALDNSMKLNSHLQAENERLNTLIAETNKQRGEVIHAITHIDEVKAEAYKEFAERLKNKSYFNKGTGYDEVVYVGDIDNLLKELVGENNETKTF